MAWRFRKSFSPIPGVRLTLSKLGITTSVGVGPFRLTSGSRGASFTARIPGTGLSFRQSLPRAAPPAPSHGSVAPAAPPELAPAALPTPESAYTAPTGPDMQEIRSAESSVLTSDGLAAFKDSLATAHRQFADIERDLTQAKLETERANREYRKWADGWLMRRIRKQRYADLEARAEETDAEQQELAEQLEQSKLQTQFEMPDTVAKAFTHMTEAFAACVRSQRIWDNVAHRIANKIAERTAADRVVQLEAVQFGSGQCGVIKTPMPVPYMANANGGDLYVYPGFVIYHASATNYALLEFQDVDLRVERTQFFERQAVPTDAVQVGTTWAKTNKDGSPDKRFNDNYAIPVMQYALLTLKSAAGLNEEYILSNVEAAESFGRAWQALSAAVATSG